MIVDSVIWIALKYKKDKYHNHAVIKFNDIRKSNSKISVTDYIILETYAFLLRKVSYEIAVDTLEMFLNSPTIEIIYNSKQTFLATSAICQKYDIWVYQVL